MINNENKNNTEEDYLKMLNEFLKDSPYSENEKSDLTFYIQSLEVLK